MKNNIENLIMLHRIIFCILIINILYVKSFLAFLFYMLVIITHFAFSSFREEEKECNVKYST
jgi:hypothetical protein